MKKKRKKKRKEEEFLPSDVAEILKENKEFIKKIALASKSAAKSKLHFPEKVGEM